VLASLAFLHMQRPEFAKFTSPLAAASNRILLLAPPGAAIMQEKLAQAIAKQVGCLNTHHK
jgi:hypothetical protein